MKINIQKNILWIFILSFIFISCEDDKDIQEMIFHNITANHTKLSNLDDTKIEITFGETATDVSFRFGTKDVPLAMSGNKGVIDISKIVSLIDKIEVNKTTSKIDTSYIKSRKYSYFINAKTKGKFVQQPFSLEYYDAIKELTAPKVTNKLKDTVYLNYKIGAESKIEKITVKFRKNKIDQTPIIITIGANSKEDTIAIIGSKFDDNDLLYYQIEVKSENGNIKTEAWKKITVAPWIFSTITSNLVLDTVAGQKSYDVTTHKYTEFDSSADIQIDRVSENEYKIKAGNKNSAVFIKSTSDIFKAGNVNIIRSLFNGTEAPSTNKLELGDVYAYKTTRVKKEKNIIYYGIIQITKIDSKKIVENDFLGFTHKFGE